MYYLCTDAGVESVRNFDRSMLEKYGSAELLKLEMQMKGIKLMSDDDDEDRNAISYDVIGCVAVLGINGATRASTNWLTRLCGIPTYDDIKMRYQQAYEDPNVKLVLNNIKSPGGEAQGTGAMSEFIANFNKKIKPVVSYTAGDMMSAAVWYGTAASAVVADTDAAIGSVGAVRVYMTQFRALQDQGIDVDVIRSGPFKAFPSGLEPMSAKGKEVLQAAVDIWHGKFVDGLSLNIGIEASKLNKTVANGKEFTAQQALSLGLIDKILPFDQLIANLNAKFDNKTATTPRS